MEIKLKKRLRKLLERNINFENQIATQMKKCSAEKHAAWEQVEKEIAAAKGGGVFLSYSSKTKKLTISGGKDE